MPRKSPERALEARAARGMARTERKPAPALHDRPMAAPGLTSYRLRGPYGWIMIGATDHDGAMREAARSTRAPRREALEVWDGTRYVPA